MGNIWYTGVVDQVRVQTVVPALKASMQKHIRGRRVQQRPEVSVQVRIHYDADGETHWEDWPQDTIKLVQDEKAGGVAQESKRETKEATGMAQNGDDERQRGDLPLGEERPSSQPRQHVRAC